MAPVSGGLFQSTHPCGVRLRILEIFRLANCSFNPRTPAGCDLAVVDLHFYAISFNPRTPAGCDPGPGRLGSRLPSFNPRPPGGCDRLSNMRRWANKPFQSTHPCGVRRNAVAKVMEGLKVSIHAPLRGAT